MVLERKLPDHDQMMDVVARGTILTVTAYALFQPFLDFGILAPRPWVFEMTWTRWIYVVIPGLAFLAFACSFSDRLRKKAIYLDTALATYTVIFSFLLLAAMVLASLAVIFGGMLLMPFIWGALAMADRPMSRSIPVLPGLGGWLVFTAAIMAVLQVLARLRRAT